MQLEHSGFGTRRGPAGLVVTVALHVGLIGAALVGFKVVQTQDAPPPIIITDFKEPATLPPAKAVPKTTLQTITVAVPVPEFTTAEPPKTDATTTIFTADPGLGGGAATTTTTTAVDKPQPPAGETRSAGIDPRFRADFQPPYPSASQRLEETGTVIVRVVIGTDGQVLRASVAKSSGFTRLDDAAVRRAWQSGASCRPSATACRSRPSGRCR